MDKKIIRTVVVGILVLLFLHFLWDMYSVFGPRACDAVYGVMPGFSWTEQLVDADGTFYVKLINYRAEPLSIKEIRIISLDNADILYTIEKPLLPLEVKAGEELTISGTHETQKAFKKGDDYRFGIYMDYVVSPNTRRTYDTDSSGRFKKHYDVLSKPSPYPCEDYPTSPIFYLLLFLMEQVQKVL